MSVEITNPPVTPATYIQNNPSPAQTGTINLSGSSIITGTYGFSGVNAGLAYSGSFGTEILASDGGAYFMVRPGAIAYNSANHSYSNGGTPMWVWNLPTVSGKMSFTNGAGTAGAGFDVTTDATIKFRNSAQSADAAVQFGALTQSGKTTTYNNVATTGLGTPAIYASGRSTAQTAAVASVATYTVGAADGSFLISANANITAFVAGTFNVTVAYTDETNTARTLTLNFSSVTGTLGVALAAAGPFEGIPTHIRAKASTSITISTAGTFTSLTYNVEGYVTQIG